MIVNFFFDTLNQTNFDLIILSFNLDNKSIVNVNVSLLKINTKNSNSLLTSNEIVIGDCRLTHTHSNDNGLTNQLTVKKENFESNSKHVLLFKVTITNKSTNHSLTNGDLNYDNGELQMVKRRKTQTNDLIIYKAEINILGSNQECLLKDGEYHLTLNELVQTNNGFNGESTKESTVHDRFKKIFWQSASQLNTSFLKAINQEPCLAFYLNWSNDHETTTHQTQSNKPYSNKNTNNTNNNHLTQQPLKQIDPPNTEINNNSNKSFTKNSNRKLNSNSIHHHHLMNGGCTTTLTNGNTNGFNNTTNSIDLHIQNQNEQQQQQIAISNHLNTTNNCSTTSSKVIYRFWFNNKPLQQTKPQSDFKCPWCGLDCHQFFSLKHHLKFNHSRFSFKYSCESKVYRVDVEINEFYDGSYDGNPQQDIGNFGHKEDGPCRRLVSQTFNINLRGKSQSSRMAMLDCETIDIDFIKPHVYGHNRLYYHSATCQPIKPHQLDYDSEEEIDPEWMRIKTQLVSFLIFFF